MTTAPDTGTPTLTVDCFEVELDNGEDLGVGNYLELDQPTAGMQPGTWVLTAYEGNCQERAQMRLLTSDEIQTARLGEAPTASSEENRS